MSMEKFEKRVWTAVWIVLAVCVVGVLCLYMVHNSLALAPYTEITERLWHFGGF